MNKGARAIKGQPRPVKPIARANSPQKALAGPRSRSPMRSDHQLPRTPVKRYTVARKIPLKPIGEGDKPPLPPSETRISPRPMKDPIPKIARPSEASKPIVERHEAPLSGRFRAELAQKIQICMKMSSFEPDPESELEVIRKRTALAEILTWLAENDDCFEKLNTEETNSLFNMIEANIFRNRKRIPAKELFFEVPSPNMFEKAWPHLEVVYLMLFRVLCLVPFDSHFDRKFLDSIFNLFSTPSLDERMELIRFVKGYYILHIDDRKYIVDKITSLIEQHLMTRDYPFQVATCLPLLVALCQAEEGEVNWLYKVVKNLVLPLIGDTYVFYYGIPLKIILDLYTFEQPEHAAEVIERILAYWPRQNTTKMCVYTGMLMDYLPHMTHEMLAKYASHIFSLIAENCNAPSPRLAEASFQIFLVPYFEEMMKGNRDEILGIMVPAVTKCMNEHWEESIRDIASLCISIMEKYDADAVHKLSARSNDSRDEKKETEIQSWKKIIASAAVNDASIKGDKLSRKLKRIYENQNGSNFAVTATR